MSRISFEGGGGGETSTDRVIERGVKVLAFDWVIDFY